MAGFPASAGSSGSEGSWDISCGCAANISLDYAMTHRLQVMDSPAELNMMRWDIGVFKFRDVSRLMVSRRSIEESARVLGEQRPVDRVAKRPGHRSEGPSEGCQGPSVARNKRKSIRLLRALSVALCGGICEP